MNIITEAFRELTLNTLDELAGKDDEEVEALDLDKEHQHVTEAASIRDIIDVLAKEMAWDMPSTFDLLIRAIAGEDEHWDLPEFSS